MSSGNVSNKKEKADSKISRILNSAMAFMIAYLLIMFFLYLSTALMGKIFGFDVQLYYFGVKFQLGRHHWTTFNISWIWGFSTLVMVILGAICSYVYHSFRERLVLVNLVALWGSVVAWSIAAAQGLLPVLALDERSPFYTNLSIVFNFWGMPVIGLYTVCILFLMLLAFVSTGMAKSFLSLSYSFSKVNKRDRKRKFFVETALAPFLVAGGLLMLFYWQTYHFADFLLQNMVYLSVIGSSLIVALIVANISDIRSDDVLRYKNLQQLSAALFVILVAVLVFFTVTWQGFYISF